MGVWVAWVRGCMGYVGQNIFYVGQHFTWVIIFTWVAWVNIFYVGCVGQTFYFYFILFYFCLG